ncbi:CBM96 family carbohydrate-binding protein [Cnuella takakiae]|nr:DNRLRE domain-containing protein [Cnuella takakiae]
MQGWSQTPAFDMVRWNTIAAQPFSVNEAQAKVVNGRLFSFGGFDSRKSTFTPTKRAYVFDARLNTWTPIADLPFTPNGTDFGGVTHAGITTDGTNIFIAGGYTSNAAGTGQTFGTNQVYRYNVASNTYTQLPSLPFNLAAGQMEYVDGKLHYIGGTNAARTEDLGSHYVLNLANQETEWKELAPLPNPRHHGGSAVVNGLIYYIGGQHEHDAQLVAQKDVHRYNPNTDTWEKMADLPVPAGATGRGHITSSVVVVNNKIIVLGGETVHNSGVTNMVSMYDPATNTWTNLNPMPAARFSGVAGFIGRSLYYSGGSFTSTTYQGDLAVENNLDTVAPIADAYVRDGTAANNNYGLDTTLFAKTNTSTAAGYTRRSYLKFAPLNNPNIVRAKLRIYGKNQDNTGNTRVNVKGITNDTWEENKITWNNAPVIPSSTENTAVITNTSNYYELDVTEFVKQRAAGGNMISLLLLDTARQNKMLAFHSRERGTNPPQLLIETDGSISTTNGSILFQQASQVAELEQNKSSAILEYIATTDNKPVSVQLNAVDDKGQTPTWLKVNGSVLNNLDYTAGSEISFDINTNNLSVGAYKATLTATATGYHPGTVVIFLNVRARAGEDMATLLVNFQDSATRTPRGWLSDFGQAYGPRTLANQGSGFTYGWIKMSDKTPVSLVGNGRVRKSQADTTLATFMHMQANQITTSFTGVKIEGIWEAKLANGTYDVTVSVGDNDFTDSRHSIRVEGIPAITEFVPTASQKFASATLTVSVSDGKITMDASGGKNTKVNFITIKPSMVARPWVVRVNPESGASFISETSSISTSILRLPNGGIDNKTITPDNVYLRELPSGAIVQANVNGTGGGDAITLVPTVALKLNTQYEFTITSNVKDLTGASFVPYSSNFTTTNVPTGEISNVSFTQVKMPEIVGKHSSLQKGPDGKLYATTIDGLIKRFTINPDGTLGNQEIIYSLQDPDSTGPVAPQSRLLIGFTFDPKATASNLIAYVTHSSYTFLNAPNWDGQISRLSGPKLENVEPLIKGLPRSSKDHLTNSLAFGPDGALYITQGSLSAMGRADRTWNDRNEAYFSGAVLRLDLSKLSTNLPLDVRTIRDTGSYDPNAVDAPLTLYASGLRNAYDLVWHSNGELYVPTNGSAAGGNTPASVAGTIRPNGAPYSGPAIPELTNVQQSQNDYLFRVKKGGYYGHPNPKRGEYVLNGGNPTNGIDAAQVDDYPEGTLPDANYQGFAFDFSTNKSPNGAIEYKSSRFNGALKGKLLVVRYSQKDDIIALTPGTSNFDIVGFTEGANIGGFTGFIDPLDITEDTVSGNIYVSEYGGDGTITLLRAGTLDTAVPPGPGGVITVNPARILDNDVSGGSMGTLRNVTIKNTGTAPVRLASIGVEGTHSDQYVLNGLPVFPVDIKQGDSLVVKVAFNPTSTGLKTGQIRIRTVDSAGVAAAVNLRSIGTSGLGGTNEPSLQAILDLYQIPILAGDDAPATNVINSVTSLQSAPLLGEEVAVPLFEKAGEGSVTIQPLAVFGPTTTNPVLGMGWYKENDSTSRTELVTVSNSPTNNGQTVNPVIAGSRTFDPANNIFGFYTRWPAFANRHVYSQDVLNTFSGAIPHHVRVYPYKENKEVVPNKYLVTFEEHISGFDFQDFMFIVSNVRPAANVNRGIVTLEPEADAFVRNGTSSNINYGKDTSLVVKTSTSTSSTGFSRNAYLRFQLGSASTVTSAKLRIYGRVTEGTTPTDLSVMGIEADGWSETSITWNNAPTTPTAPIGRITGVSPVAKYFEIDVTDFVKAEWQQDKVASFLLSDLALINRTFAFNSRENAQFKPQLIINTAAPYNNGLFVENRDRFPSNDFYVTSRVQVPWTRDTAAPFRYNANHDTARIRIHNKGIGTLVINKLNFSNLTNWKVLSFGGKTFDSSSLPLLLNPGSSTDLRVQYVASNVSTTARYALTTDYLTIESNDDQSPSKQLTLRGLWQKEAEDVREPNVQTMINAFGYTSKVGFSGKDPDLGAPSKPKGDEVISSYYVRVDTTKPVYVRQLGSYHGCCDQQETIRWYNKGASSTVTSLFAHIPADAQSLLPRRSLPSNPAEGNFSPTKAFGFKVGGKDFTDTLLNPGRKIGIRVWVAIDADGQVIPNTYLVANDYLGTTYTNFDYNDNLYIVSNIRPENGPANASLVAGTPSAVDFGSQTTMTQATFKLTLKNTGTVYSSGVKDPAIVLKGFTIVGENKSEFNAVRLSKTSIAAQDTASITVSFNPSTQGLKTADLLVYYNNTASPLRVPLYGIGTNSNIKATVVNRIKSGSSRAMNVNGKVWSADTPFAFDNLEPYSNASLKAVQATDDDSVYLIEQSSNADRKPFRYEIPVPNGTYHVRLHFAEIYWGLPGSGLNGGPGSRVMTIAVEGKNSLVNLDVAAEVGSAAALVKQVSGVSVVDGKLSINFNATANRPMVCGIEVYRFDPSDAPLTNNQTTQIGLLPDGNEALLSSELIRVYPNPVKNQLKVLLPAAYEGNVTLQIVDVSGNIHPLLVTRVMAGGSVINTSIEHLQLKKGFYFLKAIPEGKAPQLTKLVVE